MNEGFLNHPDYFGVGVVDAFPPFNTYGGLDGETYVAPKDNPATAQDESVMQPATTSIINNKMAVKRITPKKIIPNRLRPTPAIIIC